ncbi:MAG: pyrimidine/purine nucleoside phosphorylase [Vallitaleaceae bacterium]|nr:pyrimidine/purine nucleoside phosphorylase [Vallitaleaceae bacterium]
MQFDRVSIVKRANIYFDGKVTSRTIIFESGEKKTLGIMQPGEYEFSTEAKEIMEVLGGRMKVLLPDCDTWEIFEPGDSFEVKANSSFKLMIEGIADYCCSYIRD